MASGAQREAFSCPGWASVFRTGVIGGGVSDVDRHVHKQRMERRLLKERMRFFQKIFGQKRSVFLR